MIDFPYGYLARFAWARHRILHPTHIMEWNDEHGDMGCITCKLCIWMRVMDE